MIPIKKAVVATIAAAFLSAVCMLAAPASGGFTASVSNPGSTIGSGTAFLTAANGGTQCSSSPAGSSVPATSVFSCTGNQFPAVVPSTGTTSAIETLVASGTSSFLSASYTAASCGPVDVVNTRTAGNPMLVRDGVTFGQAGPLTNSSALAVDGSSGFAVDVTSETGPTVFSIAIWFKTAATAGALLGFSDSPSGAAAGNGDRVLQMNKAGKVSFGIYGQGVKQTVQSGPRYNDNAWHLAVGTVSNAGGTIVQTLYLDGVSAASASGGKGADVYNGYWRIGQIGAATGTGWNGAASYFQGSLSNAAVFPTALSAAQVTALYSAANQPAEAVAVAGDGGSHFWPLADTGLTTFTGPYPVLGATSPCSHIAVAVGTATKCVFPATAAVCAAAASTLTALVAAGALALSPGTQTVTTTMAEAAGYVSYDTGLHLLVPVTVTENGFSQGFTWSANAGVI